METGSSVSWRDLHESVHSQTHVLCLDLMLKYQKENRSFCTNCLPVKSDILYKNNKEHFHLYVSAWTFQGWQSVSVIGLENLKIISFPSYCRDCKVRYIILELNLGYSCLYCWKRSNSSQHAVKRIFSSSARLF